LSPPLRSPLDPIFRRDRLLVIALSLVVIPWIRAFRVSSIEPPFGSRCKALCRFFGRAVGAAAHPSDHPACADLVGVRGLARDVGFFPAFLLSYSYGLFLANWSRFVGLAPRPGSRVMYTHFFSPSSPVFSKPPFSLAYLIG